MALKLLLGWLLSMLFIANYAFCSRRGWCKAIDPQRISKARVFFWCAVASAGLLVEALSRRASIAMYVAPRYLESLPEYLCKLGLVPKVPLGANLVFALSIALSCNCNFSDRESLKSLMRWLFEAVVGPDGRPPAATQGPESSPGLAAKQARPERTK